MNSEGTTFITLLPFSYPSRTSRHSHLPPYTFSRSSGVSHMRSQPSLQLWLQDTHFFPPPMKSKGSLSLLALHFVPSLRIPPTVLIPGILKLRVLKVWTGLTPSYKPSAELWHVSCRNRQKPVSHSKSHGSQVTALDLTGSLWKQLCQLPPVGSLAWGTKIFVLLYPLSPH